MKIKLEIEIEVADKDGEKFMHSIYEKFEHPKVCNQILQRVTEFSNKRQLEISTISSANSERKTILFGGNKTVDIKIVG